MVELFDLRKSDIDLRPALLAPCIEQLRQAVQGLRAEDHIHIRRAGNDLLPLLAGHAAAYADQDAFVLEVFDPTEV